jgi:Tfp pilus assembly protein FimT
LYCYAFKRLLCIDVESDCGVQMKMKLKAFIQTVYSPIAQQGISLVETLMVCALATIIMSMAVPMFTTTVEQSNADAAAQLIVQELGYARVLSVGNHGNILVQCDPASNSIVVAPGTGSVRGPFVLPGRMKFRASAPNPDTPDTLGNTVLGKSGNNQITFLDNGSATTGADLCSGTFFIENAAGDPKTLRAVTLLGGTGRVRIWRFHPDTSTWK